ncbi:MAG TPA: PLP-dependent aminotransferase family protein [Puia sp.]|jgi:GntR family transcriptional regulator/MocR family aminotransferase
MIPFKNLIPLNSQSPQAIYVQLANGLIRLIRSGKLQPGTKLPSIRELAGLMDLHAKTIVAAYGEMVAQDWIYSKPRSGMIVSENLPELKPRSFQETGKGAYSREKSLPKDEVRYKYVINDGFPDPRLAPVPQLLRQYRNEFDDGYTEKISMIIEGAGSPKLRAALAKYLGETRGINAGYGNILISRGAQMAIYIAAALSIRPGDEVMVGDPGYFAANRTFEKMGAKLIRIPVDEEGIDVDQIEKLRKPKLLYIIPHHHHPTTVTLSSARRMKLLSLIRERQFTVIEDDYDYEFHYTHNPILPLASADHGGHVWYIGSITKNLLQSMRVGYLIAPEKVIAEGVNHRRLFDIRGDLLMENALATLYINGSMQRHIRKSLKLYEERRDLFCKLLGNELGDSVSFTIPDGGMAVWTKFNKPYELTKVAPQAVTHGLWMSDGAIYNPSDRNLNALRMGFASMNEKEMAGAFRVLKKVMNL